jgi:signal transduction histidine kinase
MRERIGLLGGEFGVRTSPGEGTSVTARVPLSVLAKNEPMEKRDER